MSRGRRRREEPGASHWEPPYNHPYGDGYGRRRHAPPIESISSRGFDYWRDEVLAPSSHYPYAQGPYRREVHDERWRDDGRSWHRESPYPRRERDFEPTRHAESRRDRCLPPFGNPPRQRHSTYTPPPRAHRPTFRARSPVESALPPMRPAPLEQPRKASPPASQPSRPPEPSPEYLSLSEKPSEILHDPASTRKLLVLDLNGTLLIRSPRSRASMSTGPQLRPVQPRPYMQSFRQYLFCAETKAWLDTMVWSSAQPHSVDDMVNKVFGPAKAELKAVWNRTSLGLSKVDYNRKAITTKDLVKPWNLFASAKSPIVHSALTTLLLDDSPHKAAIQPFNHVCIPEYDSTRRQHDLQTFIATKEPKDGKRKKKSKQKDQIETISNRINAELPLGEVSGMAEKEPYDAILLAVVGILEAVKLQSNVAGWVRNGELWATQEKLNDVATHILASNTFTISGSGNDASSFSDPAVAPEQAHVQPKMWFDDASVVGYWVARGRRVLMQLSIPVIHGVTG